MGRRQGEPRDKRYKPDFEGSQNKFNQNEWFTQPELTDSITIPAELTDPMAMDEDFFEQ